MKAVRRREYRGPELDGNVFDWIIEEAERIRYWGRERETKAPIPDRTVSLSGHDLNYAVRQIHKPYEPGAQAPGEDSFEVAKAWKL